MKAVSGDDPELPSLDGELVGILAGWGRFPIATAEAIRRRGGRVAILTIRYHAEESLEDIADVYGEVGVAEIGKAIEFFRRNGVRRATMAGKIHKKKLFVDLDGCGTFLTGRD